MRIWWVAAALAFLAGVLLVLARGNPVTPSLEAVVGGGGGVRTEAERAARDHVGAAQLAAGRAQQALVRGTRPEALMAIAEARRELEAAITRADAESRARILPLSRHAETLESMIRQADPAAALSARTLAVDSFQLYNQLAALPETSLAEAEPQAVDTPPPQAEAAPPPRATPAPTPGPAARHLAAARGHAVAMQAALEKEKYRNAWKAMRQLRYALGAAYQEADPALANRLAQVDVEVLEVQKSPRTQMVARVVIIRKKIEALQRPRASLSPLLGGQEGFRRSPAGRSAPPASPPRSRCRCSPRSRPSRTS
ncbi:MAG: hypothetical protein ACLGIN_06290 [Candidatus Sericytochromatia bacterium]